MQAEVEERDQDAELGDPEQCYEAIAAYVEAGATEVLLRFTLSDTRLQMRRFIDEVLPLFD